jgi:predicted MFS family arabinose efflux permease
MGTGVGIAFGQGVSGFLGPTFGWRTPFLVISIPALGCAAAVLFTVQDPERGGMEKAVMERRRHEAAAASYVELNVSAGENGQANKGPPSPVTRRNVQQSPSNEEESSIVDSPTVHIEETDEYIEAFHCGQDWKSHCATTFMLLSTPTVVLTLLQGAPGCVPWGIVNTYLNDFLSENRGMSVEGATVVVLCFGIGNFFGMVLGGAGGRYLYRTNPRYPPLFGGIMAIMGCIPFWFLLNDIDSNSHFLTIGTITVLAGIGSGATGPIVKATLQNVTLPTTRGQSFAMYTLFDDFGRGLGPVFVSILIVNLGGRTPAFNIGTLGWIVCGVLNACMFFTVAKDETKVQATLAASLTSGTHPDAGNDEDLAGCTPMVGFV